MIELKEIGDVIEVHTPYNAEFIEDLKSRVGGRKWNPSERCWTVPSHAKDLLLSLLREHYHWTPDETGETCTIRIKFNATARGKKAPVSLGGVILARAFGRDTGANLGVDVKLLEGSISSGGSRINWETIVEEGSIMEVVDFPVYALNSKMNCLDSEDYEVSVVKKPDIERDQLLEEKEKLLNRLAEIEKLLN
ncbi:hypothetical protein [Ileibacterium valens]|uniref:hypothetical protein n=1 Tax=Ileibacterium valens TaxID=1862668 RepID=UPI002731153B|nr:hypothetical protein [Ileibacterium valens]